MSLLLKRFVFVAVCAVLFYCVSSYDDDSSFGEGFDQNLLCVTKDKLGPFDDEKVLYIYTWAEYIPNDVIVAFEKITGIKVCVDLFDSNEILEMKLISNKSRYDIVFPSISPFFGRQMKLGVYQKLDKDLLQTIGALDPFVMDKMKIVDPQNEYALPYVWGVIGYAVDEERLLKIYPDAPLGSWDLIFSLKHLQHVSKGNVSLSNSASELFSTLANYMFGEEKGDDEQLNKIADKLKEIAKYVYKFNSQSMNDLFNGSSVVAYGSSSDIRQVMLDAKKDGINSKIKFVFPKEGGLIWIDVIGVPKGAKHVKNANAFLKFLYHPVIMGAVSNYTASANAVPLSKKYIMKDILNDEIIYPTEEMLKNSCLEKIWDLDYERKRGKIFTKIKSGC